ncbi:PhzF family phenazine biosynthesis protein [Neobacillus sp. D3-1R]|uniref:PhzF family phenazine biosynthesis protein n=1 Tax=Neobacillus sp. D3-1R TaxID=3445778 RepID=UPI003FA0481C
MWRDVYELSAFTMNCRGGNPAGVVLETNGLTDIEMLEIAKKVGFSETAFVFPSSQADYRIRYFTPNEEVDICGHATIATFSLLLQKTLVQPSNFLIETKAGLLNIQVNKDHSVYLEQNRPIFGTRLAADEIVRSLGLEEDDLAGDLPIQIVSTGLHDMMIPVKSLTVLNNLNPNFSKIKEISRKWDVIGYHVFTLETVHDSSAHCRNFAPLYDINEESATGTSNAALACYLANYRGMEWNYRFEQGYGMNRPSEIIVNLEYDSGEISFVQVGGCSSCFEKRRIFFGENR